MTDLAIDPDFCERLFAELLSFSQDAPGVTRAAYGLGEERAHALMRATGLALGLTAETDAAGNLFLTMAGRDLALAPWMVGSHVDTVPHGGNFDGAAGVIGGLAAVEALRRAEIVPARPVTVAVFRAEESVWFPASYVGSRAAFGLLPPKVLDLPRADTGRSLRDHMAELGLRPEAVARGERLLDPARIYGFVEMHIEQGPALEAAGIPVGFVTAISGSFRYRKAACFGRYGHSGAVTRSERSDAVFALADLITALDVLWGTLEAEGCPATITLGEVATDPVQHAFAKIPGEVRFCLDVRSTEPSVLDRIEAALAERIAAIEATRKVRFVLGECTGSTPARMSAALVEALSGNARRLGMPFRTMASGAGHDAAVLAGQGVPSTMIFIRNQNGSHNPDEAMRIADLCAAATLVAHLVAEA
ncbi:MULTISPECIES: Zn-dependent hydrolase [unclassified Methylobacterium]|uniref:Zn-dependent hydrolase n=1 Tax=unclassified Methylobacterium TaxID=2615210 RepID=UPI00226AB5C4|nr:MULTISPECIES: Zn-dependent hydrolase [unclassified Methylobacterium]